MPQGAGIEVTPPVNGNDDDETLHVQQLLIEYGTFSPEGAKHVARELVDMECKETYWWKSVCDEDIIRKLSTVRGTYKRAHFAKFKEAIKMLPEDSKLTPSEKMERDAATQQSREGKCEVIQRAYRRAA